MGYKARIKISTGYSMKRNVIAKVEDNGGEFVPTQLSSQRNKEGGWDIFFSIKNGEEVDKAVSHLRSHNLKFEKVNE